MYEQILLDGADSFKISVRESQAPSAIVLFAVGAGGDPERYITLQEAIFASGCTVVAPHFQRLVSSNPTEEELMLRARCMSIALNAFSKSDIAVVGVGHSIGAAILIALAGGQMWLGPEQAVEIEADLRLARLALLAPPTGFFQAPGALDLLGVPIVAWVGSEDKITPPPQSLWLSQVMGDSKSVDVRVIDGAGHFSFMDQVPPHVVEPLKDKQAFLREQSREICAFVVGE